MEYSHVIAIDGPSGSGKSTLAKKLAESLNLLYVDTGSMYRAISLKAHESGLSMSEPNQDDLSKYLSSIKIDYHGLNGSKLIEINGEDYTKKIREHQVSEYASNFSKHTQVRDYLTELQRDLTQTNVVVMEGRDIGTVVFPKAFCKIFLTASAEVRAERRFKELKERGQEIDKSKILEDIKERDHKDMTRPVAPLVQAEDAVRIDSSDLNPQEVLDAMINTVKEQAKTKGISLSP